MFPITDIRYRGTDCINITVTITITITIIFIILHINIYKYIYIYICTFQHMEIFLYIVHVLNVLAYSFILDSI